MSCFGSAALGLLAPAALMAAAMMETMMSAGCFPPTVCTLVGYENGLRVGIDVPAVTPDAPATYQIEVEADGDVLVLDYEVTAERARCVECTASGDRLALRDSFPLEGQELAVNIGHTDGEDGPRTAIVRVFRGGALVAEDTFAPRYQTDEPNGPGCGEHVFASAELVVP
ncbi:MAG TPA: hypothetical protein VNO30_14280 [Kofleriaceae bacterium]|nr:hypothetical protein [Kofleriaceae bacterium]